MKTTIFTRILLATLAPLALVFVLVIYTISNIIYLNGLKAAEEAIGWEATQISRQFAGKLDEIHALLSVVGQTLGDLDFAAPEARSTAETHLRRLIESDQSLLCAWFVFEDGLFSGKSRYSKSFFRTTEGVREIFDLSDELLNDPERSPWYNKSLSTGRFYLELAAPYDYGIPDGDLVTATMTAPIVIGGRARGAVGIDLHHKDMFSSADLQRRGRWLIMLLSGSGDIVYSSDKEHLKKNIFDMSFADLEAMRQAMSEGKSFLDDGFAPVAGEDSLISLYPIDSGQDDEVVYLYLSVPVSDINAMARSSVEIIISTSILGFLLLGFSVFVATRNIVRPIKRLTVDFNRISNGDLELGSGDDGPETQKGNNVVELDILQHALWKMLDQVSQAHDLRLKAAEERMEKDRLLAASQAKSQFLANMSHEIRTPMNAILGISEILLHNDRLPEQERKYVGDIKISSEALLAIINDILDISRLESGKLTLTETDFDFLAMLENLRDLGAYLAAPNKLLFEYRPGAKLPRYLKGDEVRLRQVLLNLISNACKFTPAGSVTFEISVVQDDFLRFVVADTGTGIDKEDQARLFEPFQRVESTRNKGIQGTGLGLSICSNLVEMMGGSISLKSEPGQGSVFTVLIPLRQGDETAIAAKNSGEPTAFAAGVKVLVVDDNEINLSVAEGLLSDLYGISCELANSGARALELVQQQDFDLVFMDQMMPEMDGVETAGRIRDLGGKYAAMPIVALTANAVKGTKEYLLTMGINDYLTKPIEIAEMDAVLRKWIPAGKVLTDN